ncbi:MAG TPA: radical SAM protein [Actinospica sp.]|nr:radical SAM protein [Actinospica sp.]
MLLAELVGFRPLPGAGLLVCLTRRCPLSCAHCSTASTAVGPQPDADALRRFVGSFAAGQRPEVMMLTGGEPLLRPELAAELAGLARAAGTRTALLSGMFFARGGGVPARIMAAIERMDHFSASLDVFHEREVARADVLRALGAVLDAGIPASVHLTGAGPADPYLADATAEIRRVFADRVPMLVNVVRPLGRASAWAAAATLRGTAPCTMAAWPTIAYDGTILACCNQDAVDRRPAPAHLTLGHIDDADWPTVRRRTLGSGALRLIRGRGPTRLPDGSDYCGSCHRLAEEPKTLAAAAGPVGELLDRTIARRQFDAGPVALVRRYGCSRYADLVALTAPGR